MPTQAWSMPPAGDRPESVAIGDLDGDQVPDLAVASAGVVLGNDGGVSVLLNQSPTPGDGDVDLSDFALFAGCMGGPGMTTPPPGCDPADFEQTDLEGDDGDVDLNDFTLFARLLSR